LALLFAPLLQSCSSSTAFFAFSAAALAAAASAFFALPATFLVFCSPVFLPAIFAISTEWVVERRFSRRAFKSNLRYLYQYLATDLNIGFASLSLAITPPFRLCGVNSSECGAYLFRFLASGQHSRSRSRDTLDSNPPFFCELSFSELRNPSN
jgi:hypothetical protein